MHSVSELLRLDGEPVHVVHGGTGPTVLCCNGLGQAWYDWDAVVWLLRGYRLVRFDRPGLGLSPRSPRPSTLDTEVARIAAVADHFSPADPVVLVAHSAAALHAEAYARRSPHRLAGLVLVDPSYEPDAEPTRHPLRAIEFATRRGADRLHRLLTAVPVARAVAPTAARVAYRVSTVRRLAGPDRPGWPRRPDPVPDALQTVYRRADTLVAVLAELAAYRDQAVALRARRAAAGFPPVPTTVLTGRHTAAGARLAADLSAELVVLPDAAHLVMLDRPDAVAEAVRALVAPAVT